jgi:uncharacterized delta-60 repeat protein
VTPKVDQKYLRRVVSAVKIHAGRTRAKSKGSPAMNKSTSNNDYQADRLLTPRSKQPGQRSWLRATAGRQALALLIGFVLVSSNFLLRVEAAAGDLDPTFETDGTVTTDFFGAFDGASALAIQSDGKIVAAGFADDSNFQQILALVRYDANGDLDATFGVGGKVPIDLQNGSMRVDLAIQTDGKIVVVGTVGSFGAKDFLLVRYDASGNLDPTFGVGGKVTTDFFGQSDEAASVAIQTDGKIIVAGLATGMNFYSDFALARYNANGDLDAAFGAVGKLTTDFFGLNDRAAGVAIQSDGKIVTVGTVVPIGTDTDFGLARYDTNGNLDPTFGSGGKVTTDLSSDFIDTGSAVAIQNDGKIVIAGTAKNIDFALLRYDIGGALDGTFGTGGQVTTDFFGGFDRANDVVIQNDGKIVVAGSVNPDVSDVETIRDFGLARYDNAGNLDPTFGIGGKVTTDFSATDYAEGVAIQPDCKIVAAGYSWQIQNGDANFALARYDSGGCLVASPCPKSQGHWKNNPAIWPLNSLMLGGQSYTKAELLVLLNTSTQTDASQILARQLIAAKLNVANGSDPVPVSSTIAHADFLLSAFGGKLPYRVKSSSASGQAMTADGIVLNNYNNALLTPGCSP